MKRGEVYAVAEAEAYTSPGQGVGLESPGMRPLHVWLLGLERRKKKSPGKGVSESKRRHTLSRPGRRLGAARHAPFACLAPGTGTAEKEQSGRSVCRS